MVWVRLIKKNCRVKVVVVELSLEVFSKEKIVDYGCCLFLGVFLVLI